jgi:hypothetical protein
MKTSYLLSTVLIFLGAAAHADGHQAMQLDFNQEIDQNNSNAQDLSKDVSAAVMADEKNEQVAANPSAEPAQDEKDKVTNFVDFEIQAVGQQPESSVAGSKQVIDRRYNSIEQ